MDAAKDNVCSGGEMPAAGLLHDPQELKPLSILFSVAWCLGCLIQRRLDEQRLAGAICKWVDIRCLGVAGICGQAAAVVGLHGPPRVWGSVYMCV